MKGAILYGLWPLYIPYCHQCLSVLCHCRGRSWILRSDPQIPDNNHFYANTGAIQQLSCYQISVLVYGSLCSQELQFMFMVCKQKKIKNPSMQFFFLLEFALERSIHSGAELLCDCIKHQKNKAALPGRIPLQFFFFLFVWRRKKKKVMCSSQICPFPVPRTYVAVTHEPVDRVIYLPRKLNATVNLLSLIQLITDMSLCQFPDHVFPTVPPAMGCGETTCIMVLTWDNIFK